eukprot:TRINITY_DN15391_c0_g1_i1.p1 TRINITY_DN15391_c0_g1~~TRINITY_DN15391_c0_g1_i1.p1  ORF type:complete len:208 (-),score=38.33 TRINITY_DN15391_c0_g1_i1:32-655(-)
METADQGQLPQGALDATAAVVEQSLAHLQARAARADALLESLAPSGSPHQRCPATTIQCAWRQVQAWRELDGRLVAKLVAEDEARHVIEQRRFAENEAFHDTILLEQKRLERRLVGRSTDMSKQAAVATIVRCWRMYKQPSRLRGVRGLLGEAAEQHAVEGTLPLLGDSELAQLEGELDELIRTRSEELVEELRRRDELYQLTEQFE